MVVRNAVSHDTRVLREADALHRAGYEVTIFGLRTGDSSAEDVREGVRIVRLDPDAIPVGLVDTLLRSQRRLGSRRRSGARIRMIRRRAVAARVQRRWEMLRGSGSAGALCMGVVRALRTPRTALLAFALVPFAVARLFLGDERAARVSVRVRRLRRSRVFSMGGRAYGSYIARLRRWRRAKFRLAFQRETGRAMASLRPVAYHCHDFNTLYAGTVARRIWKAPVIYDSHEIYLHRNLAVLSRRTERFFRAAERILIRRADAVITVNDSIAEYLAKQYRVALPAVVRNMPQAATIARADIEVPDAFAWPGPRILYLGGITLGRGIEQAIDALRYLPNAALIMMGPVMRAQYVELFEIAAAEAGVADRVFRVPAVPPEHIDAITAHASVGISVLLNQSLNNYYSLPNKLFSYIQAGVPVVASDFPELRRIVIDHGVGLVCDPEDPKALASAISAIVDDPETHERFRGAALRAAAELTWEVESSRILDVYHRVVRAV